MATRTRNPHLIRRSKEDFGPRRQYARIALYVGIAALIVAAYCVAAMAI